MKKKCRKPGQIKQGVSEEERLKNKMQALRMSKSRNIRQLKKIAKSLQKQVLEPVEALFIIHDKRRDIYKYLGFGKLVERFENGEPISRGNPKFSKLSEGDGNQGECEVQYLTPGKYSYPFTTGKKQLSEKQKEELSNIPICMDSDDDVTQVLSSK